MKKTILTVSLVVAVLTGCAATQPGTMGADELTNPARCLELATYCTQQAERFKNTDDWDVADQAWDALDKCTGDIADRGCATETKSFTRKVQQLYIQR